MYVEKFAQKATGCNGCDFTANIICLLKNWDFFSIWDYFKLTVTFDHTYPFRSLTFIYIFFFCFQSVLDFIQRGFISNVYIRAIDVSIP